MIAPGMRTDGTVSESTLQSRIRTLLKLEGFECIHTSFFRQKRASGISKGLPDQLVTMPGQKVWCGLEIKAKDAKGKWHYSCWEQWDLHRKGFTFIVTCEEQALWALSQVFEWRRRTTLVPQECEPIGKEPKK